MSDAGQKGATGSGCFAAGCLLPLLAVLLLPWLILGAVQVGGSSLPAPPAVPPAALAYRPVAEDALLRYLQSKGSALATPERVRTLVEVAREYQVNPLLLVAITGQEQSFVPAAEPQAELVVANPFNVFGCWCWYRPGLRTAAAYAAATVVRLLQTGPPPGFSAIQWLNTPLNPGGEYATDPRWWVGVTAFFEELNQYPGIAPSASRDSART